MARRAVSRSASAGRVKASVSAGETSTGHNAIEPAARSRHHATTDTVAPNPPDRSTPGPLRVAMAGARPAAQRSEEHTSELQSLMRNSYAVFCLKKKTKKAYTTNHQA